MMERNRKINSKGVELEPTYKSIQDGLGLIFKSATQGQPFHYGNNFKH